MREKKEKKLIKEREKRARRNKIKWKRETELKTEVREGRECSWK